MVDCERKWILKGCPIAWLKCPLDGPTAPDGAPTSLDRRSIGLPNRSRLHEKHKDFPGIAAAHHLDALPEKMTMYNREKTAWIRLLKMFLHSIGSV